MIPLYGKIAAGTPIEAIANPSEYIYIPKSVHVIESSVFQGCTSLKEIVISEGVQKLDINVKISSSKIKSELNFKQVPTAILSSVQSFYKDKNAK